MTHTIGHTQLPLAPLLADNPILAADLARAVTDPEHRNAFDRKLANLVRDDAMELLEHRWLEVTSGPVTPEIRTAAIGRDISVLDDHDVHLKRVYDDVNKRDWQELRKQIEPDIVKDQPESDIVKDEPELDDLSHTLDDPDDKKLDSPDPPDIDPEPWELWHSPGGSL
jgi:hypothetical protein